MRHSISVSVKFEEFLFKIQYLNPSVANKERSVAFRIHRRRIHKASMAGKMLSAVDAFFMRPLFLSSAYRKKIRKKSVFKRFFMKANRFIFDLLKGQD